MDIPIKAITQTTNLIRTLLPHAHVIPAKELGPNLRYYFWVEIQGVEPFCIDFYMSVLLDFERSIHSYHGTPYYLGLESQIRFTIFLILEKAGLLTNVKFSEELLNENRQWVNMHRKISVDEKFDKILHRGFGDLLKHLDKTIESHVDLALTDIHEHKNNINDLLKYHQEHGSFSEGQASAESLGYLKAAAICEIKKLEHRMEKTSSQAAKKEFKEQIHFIVSKLREFEFLDIKTSTSINEYCLDQELDLNIDKRTLPVTKTDEQFDDLLPILKRSYLEKSFQTVIEVCVKGNLPISFIMIDIDHFKKFNEEYGHTTGDDVLKLTAGIIRKIVGEKGKVVRYGGDEIAVILSNYSADEAKPIAERIRLSIEKYECKIKKDSSERIVNITVSLGIFTTVEKINYRDFIDQADTALRDSKKNGRNKITVSKI